MDLIIDRGTVGSLDHPESFDGDRIETSPQWLITADVWVQTPGHKPDTASNPAVCQYESAKFGGSGKEGKSSAIFYVKIAQTRKVSF